MTLQPPKSSVKTHHKNLKRAKSLFLLKAVERLWLSCLNVVRFLRYVFQFGVSWLHLLGQVFWYCLFYQRVRKEDIQEGSCHETESEEDIESGAGVSILAKKSSIEPVLNCCAICLEPYEPGETVVSSLNADCNHVFHKECMVEYLAKKLDDGVETPCPMCRKPFCYEASWRWWFLFYMYIFLNFDIDISSLPLRYR